MSTLICFWSQPYDKNEMFNFAQNDAEDVRRAFCAPSLYCLVDAGSKII